MEIYNVYRQGNAGKYLIQGAEANSNLTGPTPFVERVGTMYNEGAANYSVDQGLYYPTATNFGYYCTGFESPGKWEDCSRIFGVDGPEIQHAGVQTENSPYAHYTPSYGYAESPYNPYNPFIPGAVMGADGSYVGAQQYYTISPCQDTISSPGYLSVVLPPDVLVNGSSDSLLGSGVAFSSGHEGRNLKHGFASSSSVFPRTPLKPASSRIYSFSRTSEGARSNVRPAKQVVSQGDVSSGSFVTPASQHMLQGRRTSGSIQSIADISRGNMRSNHNHLKVGVPVHNGFSDFRPSVCGWTSVDKLESSIHNVRTPNDIRGGSDAMCEQNRGPRVGSSRNKLAAKPYSGQYDKVDFPVDYAYAKFFVIKSYNEDDVHKSIKYNVWSSTSHGNKKLQGAYEDAQKLAAGKPGHCPIFLFFSVNASGQFCGVAEMIGPVDFHKDMDFWQQDKWNGSFYVKWHIIKDVPNSSFRHIILENNENKPVTSSRDTQEIMYEQGMEMLKTFNSHPSRTSIFDDFVYYEDRQTVMQKEKARLMSKSFGTQFLAPTLSPTEEPNCLVELRLTGNEKVTDENVLDELKKAEASATEQVSSNSDITKPTSTTSESSNQTRVKVDDDSAPDLAICSLSINLKQDESNPLPDAAGSVSSRVPVDIVTVGSMPVRVNRNAESCRFLTVGTIPLDPRALLLEKVGASAKHG